MTLEQLGELALRCLKAAGFREEGVISPLVRIEAGSHIELLGCLVSIVPLEDGDYEVLQWTPTTGPGYLDPPDVYETVLLTTPDPYSAVKRAVLSIVGNSIDTCCDTFGYLLHPESEA